MRTNDFGCFARFKTYQVNPCWEGSHVDVPDFFEGSHQPALTAVYGSGLNLAEKKP